ncbi:hypothetical protein [Peribacillus asahii]|uniref:hypothetical protein n=1 Tax=Peribacillus asahii TaxID=228899 RepID=UPI0020798411|nr:hypothetical protein [Peribacillus asahii]USK71249.1 hypothetical protein LIS76_05655 [Peribacillus asahii]
MKGFKDFYKKSTDINYLEYFTEEILAFRIDTLNKIYKKEKLTIQIDKNSYKFQGKEHKKVSNFLVYPTHKIYSYNGNKEEHIGYKISLVKRKDLDKIKKVSLNIKLENLKRAEELFEILNIKGYKFDGSKADLKKVIEASLKMKVSNKFIYTNTVGWIYEDDEVNYVPITDFEEGDIVCSSQLQKDYKIKRDETLEENLNFAEIIKMLDITDKKVAVPLLAFTVLSSFNSLIHRKNKSYPEFMLCLHSKNETPIKEALANLFCNVFKRSQHIYSIDSTIHSNQCTTSEILEKASKISDAPFINQISSTSKLDTYIKLIKQRSNGTIILSLNSIQHDTVINLDVNDILVNQEILKFHKNNPMIFSTWFTSFILHTQDEYNDDKWGLGKKGNIDQFYKECTKMITDDKTEYDINKLRHFAWLLVGYCYFLNYGLKKDAIDMDKFAEMLDEAIIIFRELSKIEVGISSENQNQSVISSLQKDALNFLQTIDRILTGSELINYQEKMNFESKDLNQSFGFIDKTTLYLKSASTSNVYKKISSTLKEKNEKLTNKNTDIYEFLYKESLLALNDEDIPEKMKKNAYAKNVALKNKSSVKLLCLDIQAAKDYLLNNGYELHFLKDR